MDTTTPIDNFRPLFPAIEPYETGMMPVDDLHMLYWEQSGNPAGIPVICLHGGPGGGCSPDMRRFFNPQLFRIILFDQRGAGKSTPIAELHDNTTEHLIADIETLREMLGIENWHVWGGSWGSTLALRYAQTHPEKCLSLILRGIFMMRQKELDWFLDGMKKIFPDVHHAFVNFLPEKERGDILESYYKRLTDPDPAVHLPAGKSWSSFETAFSRLRTKKPDPAAEEKPEQDLAISRIEAHYFRNNRFTPDDIILRDLPKIHHIPCSIVHGRYDIICPFETAWELHINYPQSKLYAIDTAGHSSMELGIIDRLIRAAEDHIKS